MPDTVPHGELKGIAMRQRSRAPMEAQPHGEITREAGLVGDFRGRPGKRQVTVLSAEAWQAACAELGRDLTWLTRRANLLIAGVTLPQAPGAILQIGEVRLQITGETDPCSRMDEAAAGLRQVLTPDWRGGVCCRVLQEGRIQVGDAVEIHHEGR